ncbi:MAG: chorismate synthase [Methanomicrobiales archaeon]
MSGNTIGKYFKVTTFGSSHGTALGAVIDGCPAGLELSENDIQQELDKRRPGTSQITTSRSEMDKVELLSGVFQGKTDGTPITAVVYNKDIDSSAYEPFKDKPRPGHGDFCWIYKYGNYDYRGGGRGSGRTTIGQVIGGSVAKKLLKQLNIQVISHVTQIGNIKANKVSINHIKSKIKENPVKCADPAAARKMEDLILKVKEEGDSIGGIVETVVLNPPAGMGEPVFDKLDGDLAKVLMSIGSVKGVEIGAGFDAATLTAYGMNDEYYISKDGVRTTTNQAGGILGGISNGMPIIIRMAVKPTPSISKAQKTVDLIKREEVEIEIKGRHDPCICPRVTSVAEASVSIILVDHLIRSGLIHPCKLE